MSPSFMPRSLQTAPTALNEIPNCVLVFQVFHECVIVGYVVEVSMLSLKLVYVNAIFAKMLVFIHVIVLIQTWPTSVFVHVIFVRLHNNIFLSLVTNTHLPFLDGP